MITLAFQAVLPDYDRINKFMDERHYFYTIRLTQYVLKFYWCLWFIFLNLCRTLGVSTADALGWGTRSSPGVFLPCF